MDKLKRNHRRLIRSEEVVKLYNLVRYKPRNGQREPGIGVGVFVVDQLTGKILIGKRIDSGLYGLPGGWLERFEEPQECASRELKEETALNIINTRIFPVQALNCRRIEHNYHAISLIMYCEIELGEHSQVSNLEPHKCEKWLWLTIPQLRTMISNLFYPLQDFLNNLPLVNDVIKLHKLVNFTTHSTSQAMHYKEKPTRNSCSSSGASTAEENSIISTSKDPESQQEAYKIV